jgi:CheY-specific phosphatase CheX
MPEIQQETALQALADALETMAFVTPTPPEGAPVVPPDAVVVSIRFTGRVNGQLRIGTSRQFGRAMVTNLLGESPEDGDGTQRADDFLMELANITCGLMIRRTLGKAEGIEMALPEVAPVGEAGQWDRLIADAGQGVLDVEGFPVALSTIAA